MNDGHACLTIDDTKSAGFHADVRSLCDALGSPSDPPPSSGRSEAATLLYADPFADTLASPASFTSARPDWCVDTGAVLLTMTTFALWEALERGEVLAWMRVWREGMECWTEVGDIPDFAWALAGTPEPPAEPVALPEPPAKAPPASLHARTVTLEPPPDSRIQPIAASVPKPLPGARWIVIGSAVAATAVVSAILVYPHPAPPVETAGAASPPETPPHSRATSMLSPPATPPSPGLAEDQPAPDLAHHDERGQRRLPRAGRRAYGR